MLVAGFEILNVSRLDHQRLTVFHGRAQRSGPVGATKLLQVFHGKSPFALPKPQLKTTIMPPTYTLARKCQPAGDHFFVIGCCPRNGTVFALCKFRAKTGLLHCEITKI
jgi:hypothetical protein